MKNKKLWAILISAVTAVALAVSTYFIVNKIIDDNKNKDDGKNNSQVEAVVVSSFNDLCNKIEDGKSLIKINSNIEITETIYVSHDVTIVAEASYTLTRSTDFFGDMFVVGENSEGENPIITSNKPAKLTLKTCNDATLTIDGNSENMTGVVKGTAFMITNTAELAINDGVVIKDCKKLGNESVENYRVSYPDKIGGAAVIVTSGTFNMFGGEITNCVTNEDEDDSSTATHGGAIYNYGTFNMYGGKITNCKSARGGAFYNYRVARIFAGEISNNSATAYGGMVYCPNSQYSSLVIGQELAETKVFIKNNTTEGSGGAIFASLSTGMVVVGSTEFNANIAGNNGGAINAVGANIIKNATFKDNEAGSKGGAVYLYHNNKDSTVRQTEFENVVFESNTAESGGGAIGVGSSTSDYEYEGSYVVAKSCSFKENSAEDGGAIYMIRKCTVKLYDCEILRNTADNGAGVYITGKSKLYIEGVKANNNTATKGGFLYATTSATTVEIVSGEALNNVADEEKGSTIWTNAASVVLKIKGTTTKEFFNYDGEILGKGTVKDYED